MGWRTTFILAGVGVVNGTAVLQSRNEGALQAGAEFSQLTREGTFRTCSSSITLMLTTYP